MVYIELPSDIGKPYRWGMPYSFCKSDGPIVRYTCDILNAIRPTAKLVIPACDGFVHSMPDKMKPTAPTFRVDYAYPETQCIQELNAANPDVLGVLCTRNHADPKKILLPLDDDTFERGLTGIPSVPWEQRISRAFWRGGVSSSPFIRKDLVTRFYDSEHTDFRFVRHYGHRDLPETLFSDSVGIDTFVRHKYIVIVDGAVISSSHQWVFGSGSVPILITHPLNDFWFRDHLMPFVNYVPVSYSLNELDTVLRWLRENDSHAQMIASNAMELAKTIFTPEYQRMYIRAQVERVLAPSVRCSL